ncbi:P-loop containing nucleoside triphosphate hydrolase protein [Phellopilus nigrolimitatus]|nr:P-loop containing nucleoside triphosphate hydrolase protein [Phellopilus nigrolimitatus]
MAPKSTKNTSSSLSNQMLKQKTSKSNLRPTDIVVKRKTLKPLLSVSRPPAFDLSGKGKAKEKPKQEVAILIDDSDEDVPESQRPSGDDRLWVDRYEPRSEAELAVHKRKVEDVRRWLQEAFDGGPTGKLKKYRRILVLTGLAGTAKTTTVRVLAEEIGFEISEWRSSVEESYTEENYERETLNQKFETFLTRAASCRTLSGASSRPAMLSAPSQTRFPTSTASSSISSSSQTRRQVILLEDLPNILHQPTQAVVHAALESFVATPASTPMIIIISDASTRGDVRDERLSHGGGSYLTARETVDIRTVLPPNFIGGPFVRQIEFNPIAPTLMLRALQEILARHYADLEVPQNRRPTKEDLSIIVETSNGDIRSAVMALQFACVFDSSIQHGKGKSTKGKRKNAGSGTRALMEAVTRREQALALFHMMGKILYNKRKGDPPSASASAKDKLREQEADSRLKDPSSLPLWLAEHKRRTSRIDVDTLYADSPIDSGLFSLYIHQNYTQFCDDVDECGELSDCLSWIDSSGGEHWYQTNPHQFHLLTLGTLHALPTPVSRRSQKMYKPEFFEVLKKTRKADDAVGDVWRWLQDSGSVRWAKAEIVQEMGAVLKAGKRVGDGVPPAHSTFSTLIYANSETSKTAVLGDNGDDKYEYEVPIDDDVPPRVAVPGGASDEGGTWLLDDDIRDF